MCAILLSINPQHVENIMNGTKKYEFRKRACKRHVDKILIYSTNPVMKVVGEAEVEDILIEDPESLWKKTQKNSGIDKAFFDKYYIRPGTGCGIQTEERSEIRRTQKVERLRN